MQELLIIIQYDDYWVRYEIAKSCDEICSHGIVCSTKHHNKIKEALADANPPLALYIWLQTDKANNVEANIYSPTFISMRPGGGTEVIVKDDNRTWCLDKPK